MEEMTALVTQLGDADPRVRAQAATTLGAYADPCAVPALAAALGDADWWVRYSAVDALASIPDERVAPALAEAVRDPEAHVRLQAIWHLGALRDARATDALAALLGDAAATEESRYWAAFALGELRAPAAEDALRRAAATDANEDVRDAVARALERIRAARSS